MAATPVFSTVSAVTELGVTVAVYAFIFGAYYKDRFRSGLLAFALTYEVVINVTYMTYRLLVPSEGVEYSGGMSTLLAFHGTLSLLMLLGLVAISVQAIRQHKRGHNLFRSNPAMTWTFVGLWAVSIITGELVYVLTYLV